MRFPDEFKFDAAKDGAASKLRVGQHLMGGTPALIEVRNWSGRHGQRKVTDEARLVAPVLRHTPTETEESP